MALNFSVKNIGIIVAYPSATSPIIVAGHPPTILKGGITIFSGIIVPEITFTKSFNIHLYNKEKKKIKKKI